LKKNKFFSDSTVTEFLNTDTHLYYDFPYRPNTITLLLRVLNYNLRLLLQLRSGPKSKQLPNDQKIVLNHIKACQ